jgi:hypothetical protein
MGIQLRANAMRPTGAEAGGTAAPPRDDRPVRIFAANHGTQLLVILHLRRHLRLPPAREFLLWYPLDGSLFIDGFMQSLLSGASFAGTLDIRHFHSLQPRLQGPGAWWLESARRLRRDAAAVRNWLTDNRISLDQAEVWADDPMHVYVHLIRGIFRAADHIKFPHCFNQEDAATTDWKNRIEKQWRSESAFKRYTFRAWQRWVSGVDLRMERVVYRRAYSFDRPSPWSRDRRDVSELVSVAAFDATYRSFSRETREQVDAILHPIRAARKPLVLLLLFGLNPKLRLAYQIAVMAWDRGGPWQDPSYYPEHVVYGPVTSVPYWDARCGMKFTGAADFEAAWRQFWELCRGETFQPRDYILETLTLERRAREYYDIARSLSERCN